MNQVQARTSRLSRSMRRSAPVLPVPPASFFRSARTGFPPFVQSCDRVKPAGSWPDAAAIRLQRFLPLDIQVVGGLIEQIEVWWGKPQQQHAETRLLSAGKPADRTALHRNRQAGTGEDRARSVRADLESADKRVHRRVGIGKIRQILCAIAERKRLRNLDASLCDFR